MTYPNVVILICTADRPALLAKLLSAFRNECALLDCAVVIVDSGTIPAKPLVQSFRASMRLHYHRTDLQGLSTLRNFALELGLKLKPEFIAFIDDDEWPSPMWLRALLQTISETDADFVLGPVCAEYETPPPQWIVNQRFFEKAGDNFSTANLLIRCATLPGDSASWFKSEFNFSGGEDNELLSRLNANGARFAIATSAVVTEWVPIDRLALRYVLRRGFRDGFMAGQMLKLHRAGFLAFTAKILSAVSAKLGHGIIHIFGSIFTPSRIVRAGSDFCAALGLVWFFLGFRFAFYGQST